jgi:eukaryotic-like serine/threonine-protein kinase
MVESDGRGWHTSPRWVDSLFSKAKTWAFRTADYTPEEALEAAEKGLALQIRLYGPDGGPTAASRGDVARQLERMGRLTEARLLREESLAAYQRRLGVEHRYTLDAELWLGMNLKAAGLPEEARSHFVHVCEVRRRILGPDDEQTHLAERFLASLGDMGSGE